MKIEKLKKTLFVLWKVSNSLGPARAHTHKLHLPAARVPADRCTRSYTPTRTSAPSSSPPRWPPGGRPLAVRGEAQTRQIQPASSPSQNASCTKTIVRFSSTRVASGETGKPCKWWACLRWPCGWGWLCGWCPPAWPSSRQPQLWQSRWWCL